MKQPKRKRHIRRENPPRMILQERDIDAIEAIYRFRVLSQAQLAALIYGSKDTAQYRLEKLYDHEFLERLFFPVTLGEGRSPTLYILDRRGVETLRSERGYDQIKWFGTSKTLRTDFLAHSVATNDVMICVTLACRKYGFELEQWQTENEVKADYDRVLVQSGSGRGQRMPVVPDSFFTIIARERRYPFFLELDRGTMTLARFKNKIQAYLAYYKSGAYEKRYDLQSIRLLTIVSTKSQSGGAKRLANLKAATESVSKERWFWFGVLSDLTADNILTTPVWQQATELEEKVLITISYPNMPF